MIVIIETELGYFPVEGTLKGLFCYLVSEVLTAKAA